jgi:hypothetical protein
MAQMSTTLGGGDELPSSAHAKGLRCDKTVQRSGDTFPQQRGTAHDSAEPIPRACTVYVRPDHTANSTVYLPGSRIATSAACEIITIDTPPRTKPGIVEGLRQFARLRIVVRRLGGHVGGADPVPSAFARPGTLISVPSVKLPPRIGTWRTIRMGRGTCPPRSIRKRPRRRKREEKRSKCLARGGSCESSDHASIMDPRLPSRRSDR